MTDKNSDEEEDLGIDEENAWRDLIAESRRASIGDDPEYIRKIEDLVSSYAAEEGIKGNMPELMRQRVNLNLKVAKIFLERPEDPRYLDSIKFINRAIESAESNVLGIQYLNGNTELDELPKALSNFSSYSESNRIPKELRNYESFVSRAEREKDKLKGRLASETPFEYVEEEIYNILEIAKEEGIMESLE